MVTNKKGNPDMKQLIHPPEEQSSVRHRGDGIRFDMHVHSEYSPDAITPVASIVRSWKRFRVLPLVCDHNSITGSVKAYHEICADDPDIPVIHAEEILTSEGEIIGLFLQEEIHAFMSADETLDCIRDQGALSIVPHPFCSFRSSVIHPDVLDRIIHRVDIIEGFNGRAVELSDNDRACRHAARYRLPVSAGSDAHIPEELGNTYLTMGSFSSPRELLREIRNAAVNYRRAHPPRHSFNRILPPGLKGGVMT